MTWYAEYVQPLMAWLQTNPHWSLFFTFIISLAESLAIIGSIIPGSVTMTTIGILAGSGIMRIDLTLAAATLGAICGDTLSYALGYFYSDLLQEIWPFKKYPHWLKYGKDFFARHGGKSVLIGRFIGPLRSIIPVVAGILHMKQWHFLIANILSAVGWAFLYIMPGILIGAAGHELSAESATRLFIIILIILASLWLVSLAIKWIFIKLHSFLKINLHKLWLKLDEYLLLKPFFQAFTPTQEKNHFYTAGLVLLTSICFFSAVVLSIQYSWILSVNHLIHLFVQSFHTYLLETILIICNQFDSTLTLFSLYLLCCIWFLYHRQSRLFCYITSVTFFSSLIGLILSHYIVSSRPPGLLITMPGSSFPAVNLLIGTAFYSFILFVIQNKYSLFTYLLKTGVFLALGLCGIASIYLGDYWLADILAAYFLGLSISLTHYLIFRKVKYLSFQTVTSSFILFFIINICFFMLLSTYLNFKTLIYNHAPYYQEFTLSKNLWWNQNKPLLPLYRLNRIGKKISLLNIEYLGDLDELQKNLEANGWETHKETFFTKVLMRINYSADVIHLPLLTQLYENRPSDLVMTYKDNKTQSILELTIWRSNFTVDETNRPIWIGTVHENSAPRPLATSMQRIVNPLNIVASSLKQFNLKKVLLPSTMISNTYFPSAPYILLIKNKEE